MNKELRNIDNLIPILGKTLGNIFTLLLFEYSNDKLNLITSYNTESTSVDNITKYIMEHLNEGKDIINDSTQFVFGKMDKISVQYIKDNQEKIIGVFVITMKCMPFIKLEGLLREFLNFTDNESVEHKTYPLTLEGIDEYLKDFGLSQPKPTKNERIEVILDLYDLGMFNIKGAIAHVASQLQMSDKSVYRYVSDIKRNRDE